MQSRTTTISAIALFFLCTVPAGAAAINTTRSNIKHPNLMIAPNGVQSQACTQDGGTYTKHADGKWHCDVPAAQTHAGQAAGVWKAPAGVDAKH
ncbi:MAG TPA: hypothetical protein VIH15_00295 [Casimicrobiaceae bacterium]|jgi:hypothetical protein